MKNYKKVIALLMAASMTASLAACGSKTDGDTQSSGGGDNKPSNDDKAQTDNSGDNNSEEEKPGAYTGIKDADGNPIDLGGMEIIIRDWWSDPDAVGEPSNGYEEAQKAYRDWIQETYKFTIKEQAISGWDDVFTDLQDYVTTGGDENNYVFTMRLDGTLFQQMNSDLYYDLSTLDLIDMGGEKWDQTVRDLGTVNGKTYMMRKQSHEPRTGVFFNKRLLQENGIDPEEIYELQRTRQWTWDKFEEYLQKLTKDTDSDGVTDQWAFLEANSLKDIMVASNGGNYVGYSNGKFTYDLENEETLYALNKAIEWTDLYNYPGEEGREWNYFEDAFLSGKAVFMVQQEYNISGILKDMEDDFGFVAFPMAKTGGQYVDLMQDNIHVLPSCYDADRANKIAFAYSLYYAPVPDYEDYSDYYAGAVKGFRDLEAPEETLGYMTEKTVLQYHGFVPGISIGEQFLWSISKDNTPAAKAEEIRESWKTYIDNANNNAQ